jgi:hypothetical protein
VIRLSGLFQLHGLQRLSRLLGLFAVLCASACGQKGPPLAPIVYLPRPVTEVAAKRIENDIILQFTVPTVNTDGSGPADLRKIEVYAHTGPLPAPTDFLKYGTLVASVDIKQPPEPTTAEEQRAESKEQGPVVPNQEVKAAPKKEAERDVGMIEQGSKTSVRETLTPKHREIGPMPPTRAVAPPAGTPVVVVERLETPGTVNLELPPQRYYAIFPVSESRNRRGPVAGPIQVALLDPLNPPEKVDVNYTADAIALSWPAQPEDIATGATAAKGAPGATGAVGATGAIGATGAAGAPGAAAAPPVDRETEGTIELYADIETEGTQDVLAAAIPAQATGGKPKPTPALPAPRPPTPRFGYNVYEAGATSATGATGATPAPAAPSVPVAPSAPNAPASTAPIAPLNTALLTTPAFTDPRVEFGVERCYVVRRVEMAGAVGIESAPSTPACVTPVDTFPPAPPKSLAHIAGVNGVTLLWEANTEADLGGYLVLRGEAPGDKLSPLTPAPITDTSFLDTTVRRGRTYFYQVVAVDRSTPPNQSPPSERVEETIR